MFFSYPPEDGGRYSGGSMAFRAAVLIIAVIALFVGCSPAPRYTTDPTARPSGRRAARPPAGPSVSVPGSRPGVKDAEVPPPPPGTKLRGIASYYADEFHNRKTANGETFNMHGLTCAHKTLPFNTWLEVRNLANNRTVVVRVNDRGPFVEGRIIDLSLGAAKAIGMVITGVQEVEIEILRLPE